jgi:hypothetical protein
MSDYHKLKVWDKAHAIRKARASASGTFDTPRTHPMKPTTIAESRVTSA